MNIISAKPKIVLLGLMTRMPVSGVVWQTVHYLVGLQRLGYDVYYVEAHACTPSTFIEHENEDGVERAADFIARIMRRFDLGDRWAYLALHADGRCCGLTRMQLDELYRSAALIINLHGGTIPLPEHYATNRLVYLETDPVDIQIEVHQNRQETIDYLAPHCAFFTFGENLGRPDCLVPQSDRFPFQPTRQPVVLDAWQSAADEAGPVWTTIGNWRQPHRQVCLNGEVFHWSKHYEFLKFLDLPQRSRQTFELALSSCEEPDQRLLEGQGWQIRSAADLSSDIDAYRQYLVRSKGEFTVAKDQNIRLRSGWFSDRSATYLAAGRPVITQETGFSDNLPTGRGLFGFSTMDDILAAIDRVNSDYQAACRAAQEVAQEHFAAEVVLGHLLERVGLSPRGRAAPIKRLNWGCGASGEPGWINSDQKDGPGIDISGDIRDGLPLEDNSMDYIVSIHALPEVPFTEQVTVLRELRRVLKPGGVLRLALPDLDKGIQAYQSGNRDYFLIPDEDARNLSSKLILQLIWYGYSRTLFTHDFIRELLEKAGFTHIVNCQFQQTQGSYPEIVELDNRELESLFVEAVK